MIDQQADNTRRSKKKTSRVDWLWWLRILCVDIPFVILFSTLAISLLIQRLYLKYVVPIAQSYNRGDTIGDGFYEDYDNDFTYYNRHCGPDDISTRSANDLLIHSDYSATKAANVMLEHGAVAFQNVLRNDTASELRQYLAQKHHQKESLGYNEVMWDEISRLSLGIGTNDHPIIGEAMEQVGNHPVVKRTLEGILGPDPAILEVSTLTSLNGADDQGIHTDSDYFGSSLLYSRNFLHSYSMFIALQDTSKDLGATTVCPGSHYCADVDLEELCLMHGAFEVSTNGYTGEDGVLQKGDAFLFNQNIWHRGPANVDEDGNDRFMFIMTFASAKDVAAGDRRRQGLGTYYYQRFNMWGSTFSMLKDAKTKMIQPWAGLRALGLWKTRGITWIHQFCQQFANGDEFYADSELEEFRTKIIEYYQIPNFLKSDSDGWNKFIPETMTLWIDFIIFVNAAILTVYCMLCVVVHTIIGGGTGTTGNAAWVQLRRPFLIAASIGLITLGISSFWDQTELAQSVTSGDVFVKPFPTESEVVAHTSPTSLEETSPRVVGATTLPERHDVLISTRFDANFLASFNRFLDYHPGNRHWRAMTASLASLHNNFHLQRQATKSLVVRGFFKHKEAGLPTRFLLQDPFSGSWTVMSQQEAILETQRAALATAKPLIGALVTQVKYLLADSRFGVHRGTVMASLTANLLSHRWMPLLYGEDADIEDTCSTIHSSTTPSKQSSNPFFSISHSFASVESLLSSKSKHDSFAALRGRLNRSALPSKLEDDDDSTNHDDVVHVGDKVWVYYENAGQWYEGRVAEFLNDSDDDDENEDETCMVYIYNAGYFEEVPVDDIRPYLSVKSGDKVVIDYHGNFEELFSATVMKVHPDGRCSVQFDDGEVVDDIFREQILPLGPAE